MAQKEGSYWTFAVEISGEDYTFFLAEEVDGVTYIYNGEIDNKKTARQAMTERRHLARHLTEYKVPYVVLDSCHSYAFYSEQNGLDEAVRKHLARTPPPPPVTELTFSRDGDLYADYDPKAGF